MRHATLSFALNQPQFPASEILQEGPSMRALFPLEFVKFVFSRHLFKSDVLLTRRRDVHEDGEALLLREEPGLRGAGSELGGGEGQVSGKIEKMLNERP